jgi:ssDNA-binding Zn-finger/Zn-ribbon topoisomerase 1
MSNRSESPRCPRCGSHDARIDRSYSNACFIAVNVILYPIIFTLVALSRGGLAVVANVFITLNRQCSDCGMRYHGRLRLRYSRRDCPRCRYDLRHNESGLCPECGWRLTDEYRLAIGLKGTGEDAR